MAPTIILNTYRVLAKQALLFNSSKWLFLILHFAVRSLEVRTKYFFSNILKRICGA